MLTIFTIPKPFKGHIGIIQENAIKSWKLSNPNARIVIYGDEFGCAEICKKYNLIHMPNIIVNKFGTPLLSHVFENVKLANDSNFLLYINADIIILDKLNEILNIAHTKFAEKHFLISGRRIDIEVTQELDFNNNSSLDLFIKNSKINGKLHGFSGIDYFLFPRKMEIKLKEFAVGRPGWDNWFIGEVLEKNVPFVNATNIINAFHQNHESGYNMKMKESQQNVELLGDLKNLANLRNANYLFLPNSIERVGVATQIFTIFLKSKLAVYFLSKKRKLFYLWNKNFS